MGILNLYVERHNENNRFITHFNNTLITHYNNTFITYFNNILITHYIHFWNTFWKNYKHFIYDEVRQHKQIIESVSLLLYGFNKDVYPQGFHVLYFSLGITITIVFDLTLNSWYVYFTYYENEQIRCKVLTLYFNEQYIQISDKSSLLIRALLSNITE